LNTLSQKGFPLEHFNKYPKVSIQELKDWNGLWNAKSLKPGEKRTLYKSS